MIVGKENAGTGQRFLGVDFGAETLKLVELERTDGRFRIVRTSRFDHGKNPQALLQRVYGEWANGGLAGAAATGHLAHGFSFARVPLQQAQLRAFRYFYPDAQGTLISIGSHGFSVLDVRPNGHVTLRENSRCSQGTGNFLRQLTGRFSLSVQQADELCADVERAAALSGRCPVILKTDMTHLANKGENRAEILAGLFDAVCENVLNLVKPGRTPNPVLLIGGVSQSQRVRRTFAERLRQHGYELEFPSDAALCWEALGAALIAAEQALPAPAVHALSCVRKRAELERMPALSASLGRVRRLAPVAWEARNGCARDLIVGLDIGSTGAKAVALNAATLQTVWEAYRQTGGRPIEAAQGLCRQFVEECAAGDRVRGACVTGSGREIVGSLLTSCYGPSAVFIKNEIAAHAAGACHYDPRVDTIFEIGGQDAKYIRLEQGRVIDCAMNEACSAGTGSFIEEQGSKFDGITHVGQLGTAALRAAEGVSLGQHCSVFMAEVIDQAVAAGIHKETVIAGLYDSIIQNYLNRVKGSRTVGQVIFCQGMPFAADALAAAVVRQTGSEVIIPPNPGTVGALGIALLALAELRWREGAPLDLQRFLHAQVEDRTTFVCNATVGCGAPGNHCRIERLKTRVESIPGAFTWGGACALHERVTRRRKLPDRSPDPFQEREQLITQMQCALRGRDGAKTIAMSDEFMLKELYPFFATFLHGLGLNLMHFTGTGAATLKRGTLQANASFCAPMQLFHGVAGAMDDSEADYILTPVLRSTLRAIDEPHARVCPIVQSAPFLLRHDLSGEGRSRWLSPEIAIGREGLASREFRQSCARLAADLGANGNTAQAFKAAVEAQHHFAAACAEIGRRALNFAREHDLTPVVVLGRPYTIYNPILNSNVPAILREQGALAIPSDCYPVGGHVPLFGPVYWGYAQRLLRAAHQVRRTPGIYSVYCSNYSCGPDSLNLHFFSYVMHGKPFGIIETDGHSGDAGTKTRIEAFLHCVAQDRARTEEPRGVRDLARVARDICAFSDVDKQRETVLIPWMGGGSEVAAACLRAAGFRAEALPPPDREALQIGRRYTSSKECVPISLTLGRLIHRLRREPQRRFAFMMVRTDGPCRLGLYHLMQKIVIHQLGEGRHCRFVSPNETDYFEGMPAGFSTLFLAGIVAQDYLHNAQLLVRPDEKVPGAANEAYARWLAALSELIAGQRRLIRSRTAALMQVINGRLFGIPQLLRKAAREFAGLGSEDGDRPVVLLVGEIYVRHDAFTNAGIVEQLEARDMRVKFASLHGWFDYVDFCNRQVTPPSAADRIADVLKERIATLLWRSVAAELAIERPPSAAELAEATAEYLAGDVGGEAVLTLGHPLYEWRHGQIDAVVNVGPLECMPTRIAESQFFHIAEREGLATLTLTFNGDPPSDDALDNFAFEVLSRHRRRKTEEAVAPV